MCPLDFQRFYFLVYFGVNLTASYCIICKIPLSSDRKHLSYDGCLEVRGKIIRTVQGSCVLKLCIVISFDDDNKLIISTLR